MNDALERHIERQEEEIARLRLRVAALERNLDEAQLRSIEARNPGIDMDEVKQQRSARDV